MPEIIGFSGGATWWHKRPARANIAIDIDASCTSAVIAEMNGDTGNIAIDGDTRCEFVNTNCLFWLRDNRHVLTADTFIYADPPYVMTARSSQRNYYRHEYTDADHRALLRLLKQLPCMVMISGYWSDLYGDMLTDWNTASFSAQTRGGPATEWLWMNYPEPVALHDYRYLGEDFRERERIKRKASRWVNRFDSLPLFERQAIVNQLQSAGLLQHR